MLLGLLLTPRGIHREFMTTAAQVIPVLLLTLAVETRFLRGAHPPSAQASYFVSEESRALRLSETFRGVSSVLVALTLIGGELAALAAINGGATSPNWGPLVSATIWGGLAAIVGNALVPIGDRSAVRVNPAAI